MANATGRPETLIRWLRARVSTSTIRAATWATAAARRPYHFVVGAAAAGLALATAPPWAMPVAAFAIAMVAAAAAHAARVRPVPLALLAAAAVCGGAFAGHLRLAAIDRSADRAGPDGSAISGTAVLLEHPRPSLFGSSAALRMTSGSATGATLLARVDSHRPWPAGGEPGAILRISGTAKQPDKGESFDWRAYLRRRGI